MSILIKGNNESGESSKGYPIANVNIISTTVKNNSILLKWEDPEDIHLDNITFAKWSGTLLIRKEGSAPESPKDGKIILDTTERNKYKENYFVDDNITSNVMYYYRFFPYTDKKIYNTDMANITKGRIGMYSEIFGENSLDQIHLAIENNAYKDLWKIGDTIKIYFKKSPTMKVSINSSGDTASFNTPAGYIKFAIADFDRKTRWKDETAKKMKENSNSYNYDTEDGQKI